MTETMLDARFDCPADKTTAEDAAHQRLRAGLQGSAYRGYVYGYPHKTAYRPLRPERTMAQVWADQPLERVQAYLHLPFCEMRCGFCNLFTTANPRGEMVDGYLDRLIRQIELTATALPRAPHFSRLAFGGGTPTWLNVVELGRVFNALDRHLGLRPEEVPTSVETSPATATPDRLELLKQLGVQRVSIGVQSLLGDEAKAMGRPQKQTDVRDALEALINADFPILNIDLIYGAHDSPASWLHSVDQVIETGAEEVFLYPLYVRPLTGLWKRGGGTDDRGWDEHRRSAYRAARDRLCAAGYRQDSMRLFSRPSAHKLNASWPEYDNAADPMLGLGCGARSYAGNLHYASDYAVGRAGVLDIIKDWVAQSDDQLMQVRHGIALAEDDHRRRFILLWLMQSAGVDLTEYTRIHGGDLMADYPELGALISEGLAEQHGGKLRLTPLGLEWSDMIGPWFYSDRINQLMGAHEWR